MASKDLWPRPAGDVGAERNCIAVRLSIAGDEESARASRQRTSLTHVEAGYFYNLKCPEGTACGRVLLDFGQVKSMTAIRLSVRQLDSPEFVG